jgi:hypothetical protein
MHITTFTASGGKSTLPALRAESSSNSSRGILPAGSRGARCNAPLITYNCCVGSGTVDLPSGVYKLKNVLFI